jgi:UDP:flavonoid glycosyltransferase YjiC (YdhE family)
LLPATPTIEEASMIVLLPHCAFLSETSRMLSIGRALRVRGETVRFAMHGGPYEHLLRDAGEEVDRLEPALSNERCARFVAEIPGMGGRPKGPFSVEELRAMTVAEASYLRAQRADAVVTGFTLSALLSSRVAGVPLITEHAGSFVPPMMEAGLLSAPLRSPMPFVGWLPRALRTWFANQGARRIGGFCTELNVVARELGVEEVPTLAAMLMGDLTLVTDVPELTGLSREALDGWTPKTPSAYRKSPRMTYTGPLFARLDRPVPEHVSRFLEGEGPVVYVAITSVTAGFVEGVVRAVAASGARVLVAGTIHDLGGLASDRVCVGGVLPSHELFGRVALGVIAGGQGSVQTPLACGTPFVGIPLQPEQDWNVACAERVGAAVRLAPDDASGARMTDAVRTLLASEEAHAAARRARCWLEGIDGAANAADAIRTYLGSERERLEQRAA